MAITKVSRGLLNTGVSDSSDATAITIDSSERVGIGLTSPASLLHVRVASDANFEVENASGSVRLAALNDARSVNVNMEFTSTHFGFLTGNLGLGTTTINSGTLGTANKFLEVAAGTANGSGTIVLSRTTNGNNNEIGGLRFVNSDKADDDGLDSDGKLVAAISARSVTSDSNASDDSGANLLFYTKPEAGNYAERMRINSSGSVLLATTSAQESTTHLLTVGAYGRNGNGIYVGGYSSNDMITLSTQYDQTYGLKCMRGQSVKGYLYINSAGSDMVNSGSDERLKENIQTWEEDVSSKFKNIKPKTFNFIDDEDKKTIKGFIAQDMIDKFPEAYPYNEEEERYFYSAQRMVVYLMKGMQEQQEQIESLQQEIEVLKNGN